MNVKYFSTESRYCLPSYPPIAYIPSGSATAASALLASFISGSISHQPVTKSYLSAVLRQFDCTLPFTWSLSISLLYSTLPPPPQPPIAQILPSGPIATASSSRFQIISVSLDHLPFFRSKQSNFLSTDPLFPPQKNILPSSILTQAAKPDLDLGILNGRVLNLLNFRLYSSISEVLYPSICFPPNKRILDLEIGIAENLVLGLDI